LVLASTSHARGVGILRGTAVSGASACDDEAVTDWLQPPVVGERVVLRPPAAGDDVALVEMATDERVRRYVGGAVDRVVAAEKAARKIDHPVWGQFVITDRGSGEAVGSGDLARKRGPWEVSYQLRHVYWGQGLASEAVSLVCAWFFAHTDEDLLIATTQQANDRSRRLLQRLGATQTASFEQYGLEQQRFEFYRPASKPMS
jgi:ribosomal-protein-alanine N-acetyltransferase